MNVTSSTTTSRDIEDVIEDARNGRMFILVDAEDRENEGDLVIPAQMCTPQAVNFMAKYGRGLICLALTQERADALQLPMMTQVNGTPNQTAFTVSIEAKEGISTGISAHDRAHTISVAIDPTKGADDIVMPGHVFPLVARHGGALVRAGHTEAAVDIARLAGLYPGRRDLRDHERRRHDGAAARPGAVRAAAWAEDRHHRRPHRLSPQTTTISSSARSRRRSRATMAATGSMIVYVNTIEYAEHIALVKGDISTPEPVLVRMHADQHLLRHAGLASPTSATCWANPCASSREAGRGVVVLLRQTRPTFVSDVLSAPHRRRTSTAAA